jgi:hypothetical protein
MEAAVRSGGRTRSKETDRHALVLSTVYKIKEHKMHEVLPPIGGRKLQKHKFHQEKHIKTLAVTKVSQGKKACF